MKNSIEVLGKEINRIISIYSVIFYSKIRQPNTYELEDFKSIGILLYYNAVKDFKELHPSGAGFKTFFIKILLSKFIDIFCKEKIKNKYMTRLNGHSGIVYNEEMTELMDLSVESKNILNDLFEPSRRLKRKLQNRTKENGLTIVSKHRNKSGRETRQIRKEIFEILK